MISEETQERASLYALGLLDAGEAAAFEREMASDPKLRALAAELREAASSLAMAAFARSAETPPAGTKARLLRRIVAEGGSGRAAEGYPGKGKVVAGPWAVWLPWALAATLMLCCGALALSRERLRREFSTMERKTAAVQAAVARLRVPAPGSEDGADALRRVAFCPLEQTKEGAEQLPRAAVLWDGERREGKLRVSKLPPPGEGKDYQLWIVEDGRKDPVSAGVVPVDAAGAAQEVFQPVPEGGKDKAVAFALSVERAGGSPKNEGPILFLGKL